LTAVARIRIVGKITRVRMTFLSRESSIASRGHQSPVGH
jgi:hypothetical protein